MNSVVIYASHFGNTKHIAEAIANELQLRGPVQLLPAEETPAVLPPQTDLVLVGSPTEGHRMTAPAAEFFARLTPQALRGVAAAAFDTRLHWPRWLSGSAGAGITEELHRAGARVIAREESFFVGGSTNPEQVALEAGELARAGAWAAGLADSLAASAPATADAIS